MCVLCEYRKRVKEAAENGTALPDPPNYETEVLPGMNAAARLKGFRDQADLEAHLQDYIQAKLGRAPSLKESLELTREFLSKERRRGNA